MRSTKPLRICVQAHLWVLSFAFLTLPGGCRVLHPEPIHPTLCNLPDDLTRDYESMIERGKPRPIIDAFGWVWGIPSKIILWNRRVENHKVSPETERYIAGYLAENDLDEVKVRINQYRPVDDWKRLTRHKGVAWPWRYTFGAVSVLGETIFPGRLFGGDHYNPYTATIHLYSDVPAVALHEGAHAKDFARRSYPGTYAALYTLPVVPLWHERIATNDTLAYIDVHGTREAREEAYHVLFPAYGTYLGSEVGNFYPPIATPMFLGGVLTGHAVGRWQTSQWPREIESPPNPVSSAITIQETPASMSTELMELADDPRLNPAATNSVWTDPVEIR